MKRLTYCFHSKKIFLIVAGLSIIQANPPDVSEYVLFHPFVESDGKKYPAMIINGVASVTTIDVYLERNMKLCMRDIDGNDICFPVVTTIDSDEVEDALFLNVLIEPNLSLLLSMFNTSRNQQCQSLSVDHPPIPMIVTMDGSIVCEGCRHIDLVVCMFEYVGLLIHGKTLIPYSKLLTIADMVVGNDKDPQYFLDMQEREDNVRLGGNNTARDISPIPKDTVLLRLSLFIFIGFTLCILM
ncbi:hypothetical protein Trydic_g19173 [Trypoxylus dichotomus]